MRVGVIASAGGSVLAEVAAVCRHVAFHVLTDRACGAEAKADVLGIPRHRIEAPTNEGFSEAAAVWCEANGPFDFVLMFYSRLVTSPLLEAVNLLNLHPGLLPAFKGMGAVRRAHQSGARFLGCSLHVADASVDGGPLIAQACLPVQPAWDLPTMERLSFMQKAALFFLAIQLVEQGDLRFEAGLPVLAGDGAVSDRLNPALTNDVYLAAMADLQRRVGLRCL